MSIINEIQKALFAKQDLKFKAFHSKLIPTTDAKSIIGVRTPDLRAIAKEFANHPDVEKFLTTPAQVLRRKSNPCVYFVSNQGL